MVKQSLENKLENLSKEDVKDIVVVVPLESEHFNFEGYDCIRIGDIDLEKTKVSSLCYKKKDIIRIQADLMFPLLYLKLHSEGFREIKLDGSSE